MYLRRSAGLTGSEKPISRQCAQIFLGGPPSSYALFIAVEVSLDKYKKVSGSDLRSVGSSGHSAESKYAAFFWEIVLNGSFPHGAPMGGIERLWKVWILEDFGENPIVLLGRVVGEVNGS